MTSFRPPNALDCIAALAAAAKQVAPQIPDSGLSHAVQKDELEAGDHVYIYKNGYTYSHHGIVVHTAACDSNCRHETLDCCALVHFLPPDDGALYQARVVAGKALAAPVQAASAVQEKLAQHVPAISAVRATSSDGDDTSGSAGSSSSARIELTSLARFAAGNTLHRCRYGVDTLEFVLKRSGSCSTHHADLWPRIVLRALSVLDIPNEEGCERVEYDLLRKNCELLALWCSAGSASGIQRFRCKDEVAYSAQSAPLRFVRLGLVPAVAVGAAIAAPTGSVSQMVTAGSLASSAAARQLLLEVASKPQSAVRAASSCLPQRDDRSSSSGRSSQPRTEASRIRGLPDVLKAVLASLGLCLPEALIPVAATHQGAVELCEMLVDVLDTLETRGDVGSSECTAALQHFFDEIAS